MIVCHCNVITKADILEAIAAAPLAMPRSPVQVQRCLGCAPQCGRCAVTVREIIAEARLAAVHVGCAVCPASAACVGNDREGAPAPRPSAAA